MCVNQQVKHAELVQISLTNEGKAGKAWAEASHIT